MGTPTPQDRLDNRRSHGDPLVRREQALKATAPSPPAAGSGRRAEIRDSTGATVQDASRTSEQTAPNSGTSWRGAPGGDGRPGERSDGERTGPEHPVSAVVAREGLPAPDAERRARPAAKEACAAARRGVSTARTENPST